METIQKISAAGDGIETDVSSWVFSGEVPKSFDAHVSKSVPFYNEGHDLISKLSEFFIDDESICYEVGCSTGTLIKQLALRHKKRSASFIGIEVENDMVTIANNKCSDTPNLEIVCADALTYQYEKADLIVVYYTAQFLHSKHRQLFFDRIYEALNWGGALILFEKVRAPDARFQDIISQTYIDYKIDNGYTPEEILNKSKSLKKVLEPFSTNANYELMQRSGFSDITTIMKYLCFEGFLAIK